LLNGPRLLRLRLAACDWLPAELGRLLGRLDAVVEGLADVCDRLSAGIDPQDGRRG
jgi:hypothetical protein